jgi:hypothetical protein
MKKNVKIDYSFGGVRAWKNISGLYPCFNRDASREGFPDKSRGNNKGLCALKEQGVQDL